MFASIVVFQHSAWNDSQPLGAIDGSQIEPSQRSSKVLADSFLAQRARERRCRTASAVVDVSSLLGAARVMARLGAGGATVAGRAGAAP